MNLMKGERVKVKGDKKKGQIIQIYNKHITILLDGERIIMETFYEEELEKESIKDDK